MHSYTIFYQTTLSSGYVTLKKFEVEEDSIKSALRRLERIVGYRYFIKMIVADMGTQQEMILT